MIILTLVLMAIGSSLGIASLVIWDQNRTNPCIVDSDLINFGYLTWLRWTGITILIVNGVSAFVLCIFAYAMSMDNHSGLGAICYACLALSNVISGLFQLAWYVVGAILLFDGVYNNCPHGLPLAQFGLALFIIQSISICCGLFCSRRKTDT